MSNPFNKHIMLADDDTDDIELFKEAVKECAENVKVSTATDGQLLIQLLENEPLPDLIVLDLNMPRMNGFDCLRAIRKKKEYQHIPIMILSTSRLDKEMNLCMDNGADFYTVKPPNFDLLTQLVKNLCERL